MVFIEPNFAFPYGKSFRLFSDENDKTDFKVCLGNSAEGKDYIADTHTSGSDSTGSYYESINFGKHILC